MKRVLFLLLLNPLLLSCNMQKYCSNRFPPEVIKRDSIITVERIAYRDTTLYVVVPGDVVRDTAQSDTLGRASSTLATSFAISTAVFKDGKLFHELTQKDSLLALLIKSGIKERFIESYEGSTQTSIIVKNELTGWQSTQIYAAWILAGVILIQVLWKKLMPGAIGRLVGYFRKSRHPP